MSLQGNQNKPKFVQIESTVENLKIKPPCLEKYNRLELRPISIGNAIFYKNIIRDDVLVT